MKNSLLPIVVFHVTSHVFVFAIKVESTYGAETCENRGVPVFNEFVVEIAMLKMTEVLEMSSGFSPT